MSDFPLLPCLYYGEKDLTLELRVLVAANAGRAFDELTRI